MADGFVWALLVLLGLGVVVWLALSIDRAVQLWRGQLEDDD